MEVRSECPNTGRRGSEMSNGGDKASSDSWLPLVNNWSGWRARERESCVERRSELWTIDNFWSARSGSSQKATCEYRGAKGSSNHFWIVHNSRLRRARVMIWDALASEWNALSENRRKFWPRSKIGDEGRKCRSHSPASISSKT
jgi:hypothetical protein